MLQAYNFGFDYVAQLELRRLRPATRAQLFAEFAPAVAYMPAMPVPVGPLAPALSDRSRSDSPRCA